jgi:hypothetical protein
MTSTHRHNGIPLQRRATVRTRFWPAAIAAALPGVAQANCGTAFCAVNTDWNVQGIYAEPGARAELRYEYLDQDQLRSGKDKVEPGEEPRHHDELSTLNQAWFATLDYNFASGFGVSAVIPVVQRDHEHIHNHHGAQIPQEWDFTELSDIRVTGRYQFPLGTQDLDRQRMLGFLFGLKLPTGATDVENDEGEQAERSLQPGTGTTDAILGAYYQVQLPARGLSFFTQAAYAVPLNTHDEYRPGYRTTLDVGMRYQLAEKVALLLQLNAVWRGHDSGAEAEPDDSGGQFVFVSPGISVSVTRNAQLFALVQLPVYQYVNGVQLTADWGATGGLGLRF